MGGLKEMPKVGDKLRYLYSDCSFLTEGKEYEVIEVSTVSFYFVDDEGDRLDCNRGEFDDWELVTERQPDALEKRSLFGRTPEVGDVVKIHVSDECPEVNGSTGVVTVMRKDGYFIVDIPSEEYGDYTFVDPDTDVYEISKEPSKVTSEPQPDVYAILANLGRRLHEVEAENKKQAVEINDLYKAVVRNG